MANTMVDCAKLYSIIAGPDLTEASRLSWYQPKVTVPRSNGFYNKQVWCQLFETKKLIDLLNIPNAIFYS